MQGITIELMKQYTASAYRVFNRIELLVSFEGVLTLELNGKLSHYYHQVAIINHNDIVNVKDAQAVAKISIPLRYFSAYEPHYLLGYFNQEKLSSHNKITSQIKKVITEKNTDARFEIFLPIIEKLLNECFIVTGAVHVPQIQVKSILFNNIMDYVHQRPLSRLSLPELSEHFFVTESYISTLFNRYLNYTFKKYFVSLKIGLSIYHLLNTNESINQIASYYQFSSYNHYSKQFKRFIGVSPITFRKQHQQPINKVHVHPFDYQYFEGHLFDADEQVNTAQPISIYLNQSQQTQWIPSKQLLLEVQHMREVMQIFNSTSHVHTYQQVAPIILYFNRTKETNVTVDHLEEAECLSKLVQQHQYGIAYRISSMQNYEKFKLHFLQPLLHVLRQSSVAFDLSQLNFNLVLDEATMSAHDINFIVQEMQLLLEQCRFTLLLSTPIRERTLPLDFVFDYYMVDMAMVNSASQSSITVLQLEHPFHRQFKDWLDEHNMNQCPILITGVNEWLFAQQEVKVHPREWLDIWLNMHHTVQGLSLPLICRQSEMYGYFDRFGHQTALQHVFYLLQPFNHSHCVVGHSYIIHESPHAYDILLFHPYPIQNNKTDLTYELYGTLELQQHFIAEYTYHPKYSNIDAILDENTKGYYLPPHFISAIHTSNQLLVNIQRHHFGESRYQTMLPKEHIKLMHILKTPAQQESDML
ncbi:helix-turn-helix domain-containing protein [Staphylococcus intermedius]|uniref:AraC family transcriptional regulator n=1 Tax=Staphylococcus intermedius NCTC 11048 TaxID=1141106 RepID=A0A380G7D0_STAIN|nr:helix-turn-helix domain-containing protein [Staphylococcus intermedius]PCF63827.1 AraC family transcriptional regulator [Staphylococcus intermedius]PCF78542.1 AraC family transcriptional regulator [Staphylococcus intermedius]PCF79515.1 AraC family transcriptional regulator [Staphylococcus intermedius]PCF86749.1 AraC family transcriptional regulator [Staphylococcus intermedius]PCF89827.1 AraC family transcriptional regulator [Staphylococcus intermedius]